jgi:hypothetical protein
VFKVRKLWYRRHSDPHVSGYCV